MKKIILTLVFVFFLSLSFVAASECSTELCIPSLTGGPPVCHDVPAPGAPCTDDGNLCTTDVCNTDGVCEHALIPGCGIVGPFCGDLICNNGETCLTCMTDCGICIPIPCDDGNACTTNDMSIGGICIGTPITCNDNNAMTTDSCDPASGCVFTPIIAPPANCDDGNACTNDIDVGSCMHFPVDCNDNNALTTNSCDPQTGCVYTPIAQEPSCGDGTCNGDETCSTCISDCGACQPFCGDFSCNNDETCSTCITDCGPCMPDAFCGDQQCNGDETCSTCESDCGECAPIEPECTNESTVVGGTIYQDTLSNGIDGAIVEVICHHGLTDNILYTFSGSNGQYSVAFPCNECDYDDDITVNAQKDSLTGTEEGEIDMTYNMPCGVVLNVGIVNVPLVPEFGTMIGVLTVLGALGVFFIVRRK